jgi:hypothetical protein
MLLTLTLLLVTVLMMIQIFLILLLELDIRLFKWISLANLMTSYNTLQYFL